MLTITEKPGLLYKNHQIFDELWLKYKLSSAPDFFLINDTYYSLKNQGRNLKKNVVGFVIFWKLTKISGLYMHTETRFFLYSKYHQKFVFFF